MKMAACSSITSARRARDVHADQLASTATVESRSSQKNDSKIGELGEIAGKGAGRLRARAFAAVHVDGRPSTKPAALRSPAIASRRAASAVKASR